MNMELGKRLSNLNLEGTNVEPLTTPNAKGCAAKYHSGQPDNAQNRSSKMAPQGSPDSDRALSRIYRYSPVPTLILDECLHIVEVSDSHSTFSGQSRDTLMGTCVYDIQPYDIPVTDTPSLCAALRAAITSKEVQIISRIYLKGGKNIFQLRITPIFERSSLIYVVLEAQNTLKRGLVASEGQQVHVNETYKILIDSIQDHAIFMLDTGGRITTWNPGAQILKGYPSSEIIGRHFSMFYSPDDRRADKPGRGLIRAISEGRMEDEGWRYRKDGSRFWANVIVTPIHQLGYHVGFVKVTRDLTRRKAAEERMIAAFEESSKMKTDFLANMSHEIRTPMNGMALALTMMKDTDLNSQQLEYALILEDSMSILLQIINDVLDYSKLSSGSFSLNTDVVNIRDVHGAVIRNCKPLLKPGVELTYSLSPNLPQVLLSDPLRYRQIVQTLVGNAVKFTESGRIRLSTAYSLDDSDMQSYIVTTELADTGVGIPDSAINTLFTPFTRFADSAAQKYQGTGLGLSICKSLVELMGGTMGYRPGSNGLGSVFWFTVRMAKPTMESNKNAPTPIEDPKHLMSIIRNIAPEKHILLVEDNLVNQMVMLKLLQGLGFERIDTAWDGAEAVRLVNRRPLTYSAILMDISMPVLDGLEATSQIRDMGVDVPIIALTANTLKGDKETYLAKGMSDYVGKPVNRNQLMQALGKWVVD